MIDDISKDELLRKLASMDIKIDLRRLQEYSAYLQGARKAVMLMQKQFPELSKGKDAVYNKAALSLITDSLRNTDLWLSEVYEMRFRNHKRNKKGKLLSCEAYFSTIVSYIQEVK
jgi:hypothetical protein